MMKKVEWIFDPTNSTISVDLAKSSQANYEKRFSFKLIIYKDADTHIENLEITNFKDGDENGSIVTSVIDLGKDILDFKKFGVVIDDTYFFTLARQIKNNYADIEVKLVDLLNDDDRYSNLIEAITSFFSDYPEYVTAQLCYIPVNLFNGIASDCGYWDYEMKSLRSQLVSSGYVKISSGRFAMLKRLNNKPERAVAFDRVKLGVKAPAKDGETPSKKGNSTRQKDGKDE